MVKRITITIDEDMYVWLLEHSLEKSKAELRNYSMSQAIRELLELQMKVTRKPASRPGKGGSVDIIDEQNPAS